MGMGLDVFQSGILVPGAARRFSRRCRDRLRSWIAESDQNIFRFVSRLLSQMRQSAAKGCHPKVFHALRSINSVNKSRQVDQFAPGIHEIKIQNLLARHNIYCLRPNIIAARWRATCESFKVRSAARHFRVATDLAKRFECAASRRFRLMGFSRSPA